MYEKFYGLKTSPFRLSPDPAFFFGSKGHMRALAYLRYGINQREGFIVITGTPGTGKTTLARALLGEMSKSKTIVSELNTTHLQADDVLRMVAASYGLAHENAPKATLLKRLEDFLISRFRAGYHVLLIVDESQNLPKESLEELRMLSNFYIGKDALMQIFLLGQEQFREKLYSQEMEQLRQRVVASCHLEPLGQDETKAYILHRLAIAGWKGHPQISDRAFARIFSVTKGVPRRINTFCDRLFLYGALENKTTFRDEEIKNVAKELSLETSPKDRHLADIKPADATDSVSVENIDTEHLTEFTDEVKEFVPPPEPEPEKLAENDQPQVAADEMEDTFTPTQPERYKAVSNGNDVEALEPMPEGDSTTPFTDEKPDWWELVALAVDYSLAPEKYKGIASSKNPLPAGITDAFKVAIGKKTIPPHMRTGVLENITDETIQKALRFYIKNVLLSSTADYYRRLGVDRNAGQEHIRNHYKYLFRLFQPDKEANPDEWDETYTRRINQAYGALRSEQKRKEYDEFLLTLDAKKGRVGISAPISEDIGDEVEIVSHQQSAIPRVTEKKSGNSALVASVVGIILLGLAGGGYYYYQEKMAGEGGFDFSAISKNFVSSEQKNENSNLESSDSEKVAKIVEELPLVELPKEVEIPADNAELSPEGNSKTDEFEEKLKAIENEIKNISKKEEPAKEFTKRESKSDVPVVSKAVVDEKSMVAKESKVEKKPEPVKKVAADTSPVNKVVETKEKIVAVNEVKPLEPKVETPPAKISVEVPVVAPPPVVKVEEPVQVAKIVAEKPKVKESLGISQSELNNFISDFTLAYEEGVIDKFIPMFTLDSATNDAQGRESIKQDYETLFNSTEMRVIDLQGLVWDIKGASATGDGGFVVTVLRKGGGTMRKFTGNIKLNVVKRDNKLQISGMYHAYGNNN